jgi:hypothetical protein
VKITAEDLTRQYREMSDGELLSLDPGELQDLARQCLEKELARRSLTSDPGEPPPVETAAEPDGDQVRAALFTTFPAAKMAQSALEAAGIPSFIERDSEGVSLMVGESAEHDARELLTTLSHVSAGLVEDWLKETLSKHRVMIEDMLAEDDLVAARLTIDGKHQAFCFARIDKGKVAETWTNFDQLGL